MHTKKNPKPSYVMVRLVERSIHGPDAAKAKEELLKRIGTMERNNSMFCEVNNALESLLFKVKKLSSGRSLSNYSSPNTISGRIWWILDELETQEKDLSVKKIKKIENTQPNCFVFDPSTGDLTTK